MRVCSISVDNNEPLLSILPMMKITNLVVQVDKMRQLLTVFHNRSHAVKIKDGIP